MEAQGIRTPHCRSRARAAPLLGQQPFWREVMPLLLPISLIRQDTFSAGCQQIAELIVKLGGQDVLGRRTASPSSNVARLAALMNCRPFSGDAGRRLLVSLSSMPVFHLSEPFQPHHRAVLAMRHPVFGSGRGRRRCGQSAGRPARRAAGSADYAVAAHRSIVQLFSGRICRLKQRQFELPAGAVSRARPGQLVRMAMLIDLVKRPDLMLMPFRPVWHPGLSQALLFERRRKALARTSRLKAQSRRDLLREAVHDPFHPANHLRLTPYGSSSVLIDLPSEAFRQGKEVTALIRTQSAF